jgi:hypothetical protein
VQRLWRLAGRDTQNLRIDAVIWDTYRKLKGEEARCPVESVMEGKGMK